MALKRMRRPPRRPPPTPSYVSVPTIQPQTLDSLNARSALDVGSLHQRGERFSVSKNVLRNPNEGFFACFAVGWGLSIFSTFFLWTGNTVGFVILYSFGNCVALFSTGFLLGPVKQCKNMFKPIRAGATVVYLVALFATLIVAFTTNNGGLTLLCVAVQFAAGIWYTASYIPYGRSI